MGNDNTGLGYYSGVQVTGDYNTAGGMDSGNYVSSSHTQVVITPDLAYTYTGLFNTAFGTVAGYNVSGVGNTGTGAAASNAIAGDYNSGFGQGASTSVTGSSNTGVGYNASGAVNGSGNTGIGSYASVQVSGNNNLGGGYFSSFQVTGNQNAGFGSFSSYQVLGSNNVGVGAASSQIVTGNGNTGVGVASSQAVRGDFNSAIGNYAGESVTGSGNTALGAYAGSSVTAGYSTAVGYQSKASQTGSEALGSFATSSGANSVAVGYQSSDGGRSQRGLSGDGRRRAPGDQCRRGHSWHRRGEPEPTPGPRGPAAGRGLGPGLERRHPLRTDHGRAGQSRPRPRWRRPPPRAGLRSTVAMRRLPAATPAAQGSYAAGPGDIAIGTGSQVHADNSTALGTGATIDATSPNSTAIGANASVGPNSAGAVALGYGAQANAPNSVALGSGSIASAPNTVSVGSPGSERRITNVAPGVNPTDAVNLGQLNSAVFDFNHKTLQLRDGVAMALAASGSPGLLPGRRFALSANVGGFDGAGGFAAGATALLVNSRDYSVVVNAGVGVGFDTNVTGVHGGVSVQW